MDKLFLIYIDRLKDGHALKIKEKITALDLALEEETDLHFSKEIVVNLEAYLAEGHLILHYALQAEAFIPCTICNQNVSIPIQIESEYHTEPLENIKSHIFDATAVLRESILLQVPLFAECGNGACPEREAIAPFLAKGKPAKETYQPFADL